ncbi:protein DENND6B isoform X2 [Syngnathus scovelli]|uniref:protein DENND6B isoform X2 n=1 Tax=Syngnathus scovelli TaxID=161590 RepID=UPI00211030CE|nr:protein DENND6B isoform X2 [Syngnathus scovelli]
MPRGHPVQLQDAPVCGSQTSPTVPRPLRPRCPSRPAERNVALLRLRLLPASQGRVGQARVLPEVFGSGVAAAVRPALLLSAAHHRIRLLRQISALPGNRSEFRARRTKRRVQRETRLRRWCRPRCLPCTSWTSSGRSLFLFLVFPLAYRRRHHPSIHPFIRPSVRQPSDPCRCFQSVLIHLQMLWELALLGEPVVVMAPSPAVSSEMVLALVSSIAPLKFCCDFRPYFTVHDSEFREYTTRTQAPPNVILGVTNPFFIKTFHGWPHVLRLGENTKLSGEVPKQLKIKKVAKLKTPDAKPGFFTAYESFLLKDKMVIKRLLKGVQRRRPSEVQSAILRRHFLELTHSFIIPLERYMASLMPPQRSVTPWKTPPQIRPFSQDEFMAVLERGGPQLTSTLRGDRTGLYRKFFKSPNFDGWYRQRLREMTGKLERLHLEVICEADLPGWSRDKSEVEIVDLVLKLRDKLTKAARQRGQPRDDIFKRLESLIATIVSSLPQDLQDVLEAQ